MAAAAILKNRKITIFQPRFDRFRPNLAWRRRSALSSRSTVKSFKFWKSKMAVAAILKNRKIAISRPWFDRFRQNLARRRRSALLSRPTVINLKFEKSNMAADAILKNRKIAISRPQFDWFRQNLALTQFDPLDIFRALNFQNLKIQVAAAVFIYQVTWLINTYQTCPVRPPKTYL